MRGLLYYLFTEGQPGQKGLDSEHRDPRVIASWDGRPEALQVPVCEGRRDFTDLASRLNEPLALLGLSKEELKTVKPVWHLTIAAAKDRSTGALVDPHLTDAQWAGIAAECMHQLGLARRDDPARGALARSAARRRPCARRRGLSPVASGAPTASTSMTYDRVP